MAEACRNSNVEPPISVKKMWAVLPKTRENVTRTRKFEPASGDSPASTVWLFYTTGQSESIGWLASEVGSDRTSNREAGLTFSVFLTGALTGAG